MSTSIDNIVVGTPLVDLHLLGVTDNEHTVFIHPDDVTNDNGDIFLPALLKHVGMFPSTGQVRQINQQRMKSEKFKNDPDQDLWRSLDQLEFTNFKIGKRVFWLIVGE